MGQMPSTPLEFFCLGPGEDVKATAHKSSAEVKEGTFNMF